MKEVCNICEFELKILKLFYNDRFSQENFYTTCCECGNKIEIDQRKILDMAFITDVSKMDDFKHLTKEEFLNSYSYLTEDEYDATMLYYNWLRGGAMTKYYTIDIFVLDDRKNYTVNIPEEVVSDNEEILEAYITEWVCKNIGKTALWQYI